jgi:hypothetical protein
MQPSTDATRSVGDPTRPGGLPPTGARSSSKRHRISPFGSMQRVLNVSRNPPSLFLRQQTPDQQAFPTRRAATQMRGLRRATNVNEPKRSLRKSARRYGPTTLNL